MVLHLPRIDPTVRQEEEELHAAYGRERPLILGALCTAISGTFARLPETRLTCKPRMADFARWATAAEVPLGFQPGAFLDAYSQNHSASVQETLESDPVVSTILAWFDGERDDFQWDGICEKLLEILDQKVGDRAMRSPAWPRTPRKLSSQLRRLVTFLREAGIEISFPDKKGTGGARILTIRRITARLSASTATTASPRATIPWLDLGFYTGGKRRSKSRSGG